MILVDLETMGDKSTLFDKYNVLSIVGTENPDITNVPFLSYRRVNRSTGYY